MDPTIVSQALHLLLALGLGAAVGVERGLTGHPAGFHTHALVALGSAAFVIAGVTLGGNNLAVIAAQVVTGSGFLCAGVILHRGVNIQGLNTAATIWCVSAIGVMAAVDRAGLACVVAAAVLLTNTTLHFVDHRMGKAQPGRPHL